MNEKYYAAYLNNEEQLKLSSSGGMAYAISEQIILSGGVVADCHPKRPSVPCSAVSV